MQRDEAILTGQYGGKSNNTGRGLEKGQRESKENWAANAPGTQNRTDCKKEERKGNT